MILELTPAAPGSLLVMSNKAREAQKGEGA
jgi:hypothetical protein